MVEHRLSVQRSCTCIGLSRAAYYKGIQADTDRDAEVIAATNGSVGEAPSMGVLEVLYIAEEKAVPMES